MSLSRMALALPLPTANEKLRRWRTPIGSAFALSVAATAQASAQPVLLVTKDSFEAHQFEEDLRSLLPADLPVLPLPDWETLPYEMFSPHPELVAQRIQTLIRLPHLQRGVVVVPVSTLLQRLAPRRYLSGQSLHLKVGQRLDLANERRRLEAAGFRYVGQVLEPGDYTVRGSLLDLFPIGAGEPYRIELFDNDVESIRSFDPETQRSSGQVRSIELQPAREFPFDEDTLKQVREKLIDRFDLDARRSALTQDLKNLRSPAGIEFYLPLFFEQTETLFEYFAQAPLVLLEHAALEAAAHFLKQAEDRYQSRCGDIERPILPVNELYLSEAQLRERLNQHKRIQFVTQEAASAQADPPPLSYPIACQPVPSLPIHQRSQEPGAELKRFLAAFPGRVLLAVDSAGRREALLQTLTELGLRPALCADWRAFVSGADRFALSVVPLSGGFALSEPPLAILTEQQLLGERARSDRKRVAKRTRDPASIIQDLSELNIGAPVVHSDHGVGRYQGLVNMTLGEVHGEFLLIEYAGKDKLYVPVSALDLVSRYTGGAPETAPLHSMGSDAWSKAKRRAAERVRDVAAELLEIYAKRQAKPGMAIAFDRVSYEQFAASFAFEETPDQRQAIEAVIADLTRPHAMDRVVCGDVGFGKTEVALRAAFVAAHGGKQVAVLVPTTLLAQQHYRNFADRFADWPIRVELVSRFQSAKETKVLLERLADGQIDVLVGTHKLLSPDVRFKDLGLIIVDEEQRFGVRQKEQLKKLRAEVDLLTLTATPIPRTLNMSLAGLRDLSIIATPPKHRLAVKTVITPWDESMIKEAFQREFSRGGQVYFLHNEVDTIDRIARELAELVPDARIRIAHGQMPERELEQVMLDFYRQRCNVLLCSTIIENGIDVPTANTIIIKRADKFGLAQLHQLRGRVGRSHHRAYAYLITPDRRSMTTDAIKRLEALASLEELGAGFTLATHDLEIRGAGELLGEEQSGQISEIGFALYSEMLDKAVKALKSGKLPDFDGPSEEHVEVDLHVPTLIPDSYLPDVHARLTWYKRISGAADAESLDDLNAELVDRFGALPPAAKQLFSVAGLKLQARALGIKRLSYGPQGGRILFHAQPKIDACTLIQMIQREPKHYKLDGQDKLRLLLPMQDPAGRVQYAHELLRRLSSPG